MTTHGELRPGDQVLDLGSGDAPDVLLSAREVGPGGRVVGLCAAPDTAALARGNAARAGAGNVRFVVARIEDIPLRDGRVDVVLYGCTPGLPADRPRALAEAFRVLRPGGRLGVREVIAGDEAEYRDLLLAAGFTAIRILATPAVSGVGAGARPAVVQAVRPAAPAGVLIRPMRPGDAGQVLSIYQAGLDSGHASFETIAPSWDAFDAAKLRLHRHVATDTSGRLLGWVAAIPVSARCVYAGVVEHSVYIRPDVQGRGVGAALLAALIGSTESAGIWTIQSGIFPENAASIRLHERAGFRVVGTRERIGRHHGRWRDVTLLERRSTVAGDG